ncbi:M15 family metallopeptidase [Mucilaginibacter paludis]|uniref:D-alanyl-D-alanine dipeptidase n=1 Tax=Mucilaginibacter paludis DSM 18603 TaxID=714943 RepID=H1Y6Q9_9SPHI|nr:M15 family metallopeptidase [Mucilaginibacter paludis]EHQ26851.1 peptidase M15D vanX D-ala-D-ala dipeptidase [Mucilaginibacter paludis DSM 18603]
MRYPALILLLFTVWQLSAQNYRDSLHVAGKAQYLAQVSKDHNKALVEIKKYIPAIQLDIRYATTDNFMHQRMYTQARAFTRLPVAKALMLVMADLKEKGLGIKVYDGYRPYAVTEKFYEKASDKHFVADPKKGSKHNRGCALDLSLIDLKTGKELEMPTSFDSFSPKAAADYTALPQQVIQNRELLKSVMQSHGFKVLSNEWWHFDFNGWQNFELLDVPFNQL